MSMRSVAMVAAVCAMLAAASASAPENTFVEGVDGAHGSITGAPVAQEASVDKVLDSLNKGGTPAAAGNDVALKTATSYHSVVVCENPNEVVCPSGVCASVCPTEKLTDQGNGGGFNTEFTPSENTFEKAPNVQGSAKQFSKLATNHAQEKTRITNLAIQNAEEAAGLSGASDHQANEMKTQKLAAEKQEVDEAMNRAAAAAAAYKAADAAHTAATVQVGKGVQSEEAQEAIVKGAAATLAHEKQKLAEVKVELRKLREAKANAMYHAETTASEYETLKAAAIAKDNALQEYIRQEKKKVEYREVAEKAVEAKAAEDLKAEEEQAAKDAAKTPATPPALEKKVEGSEETKKLPQAAARPVCSDCSDKVVNGKTVSGLPAVYAKAEGFCSDCAEWKSAGQCDDAKYKTFMAHYCQKSCGCRDYQKGSATTQPAPSGRVMDLHQMPTVKGLTLP